MTIKTRISQYAEFQVWIKILEWFKNHPHYNIKDKIIVPTAKSDLRTKGRLFMTKDDFKRLITSQLKQPDSALRAILLNPQQTEQNPYVESADFVVSEFELQVHMKPGLSTNGESQIEVEFKDYQDGKPTTDCHCKELAEAIEDLQVVPTAEPFVDFVMDKMVFGVRVWNAWGVEYNLRKQIIDKTPILEFDPVMLKFCNMSHNGKTPLEVWREAFLGYELRQLPYEHTEEKHRWLGLYLRNRVDYREILSIVGAFSHLDTQKDGTDIEKIIQNLQQLKPSK